MNTFYMKPDKSALLEQTVNQIKQITTENACSTNEDVQQSQVSSSRPTLINTEVLGGVVLEALDGFLLVINSNGRIDFVSENVPAYIGYNQDDLIGKTVFNLVHLAEYQHFQSALSLLSSSSTPSSTTKKEGCNFNCRMNIKAPIKGQPSFVNMQIAAVVQSYNQLKDSSPPPHSEQSSCLVCIARRLTPEKAAQAGRATNSTVSFITKQDEKGEILNIESLNTNPTHLKYPDMIGSNIKDWCLPADQQLLIRHFERVLTDGTDQSNIYRLRFADSRYAFVRTKSTKFQGQNTFIMSEHTVVRECEGDHELKNSAGTALMKSLVAVPRESSTGGIRPRSTTNTSLQLSSGGSMTMLDTGSSSLSTLLSAVGPEKSEVSIADVLDVGHGSSPIDHFSKHLATTTSSVHTPPPSASVSSPPTSNFLSSPVAQVGCRNVSVSSAHESELQLLLGEPLSGSGCKTTPSVPAATLDQYRKLREAHKIIRRGVQSLPSDSKKSNLTSISNSKLRNLLQDDDSKSSALSPMVISANSNEQDDAQCPDSSSSKTGTNYILKKLLSDNDKLYSNCGEEKEERNAILKTLLNNEKDDLDVSSNSSRKSSKNLLKDILRSEEIQENRVSNRRSSVLSQEDEVQSTFSRQTSFTTPKTPNLNIENVFSGPPTPVTPATPATPFNDTRTLSDFLSYQDGQDDDLISSGPAAKRHKPDNGNQASRPKNLRERNQLLTKLLSKDTSKDAIVNTTVINPAATPAMHVCKDRILDIDVSQAQVTVGNQSNVPEHTFGDDLMLQQVLQDASEMRREYSANSSSTVQFTEQSETDEILSQLEQLMTANPDILQTLNSDSSLQSEQIAINKITQELISEGNKHASVPQLAKSPQQQGQQLTMIVQPVATNQHQLNQAAQIRQVPQANIPHAAPNVRHRLLLQSNHKKMRELQRRQHIQPQTTAVSQQQFQQIIIQPTTSRNTADGTSLMNLNEMMNAVGPNVTVPQRSNQHGPFHQQPYSGAMQPVTQSQPQPQQQLPSPLPPQPLQPSQSYGKPRWQRLQPQQVQFDQRASHTTTSGRVISSTDHPQQNGIQNLDDFLGQQNNFSATGGSTITDKRTLVKQELRNLCNRKQQGVQQNDQPVSQDSSELPDDITTLLNEIIQQPQQTNTDDNSLTSQQSNSPLTSQLAKQFIASKKAESQKNTERMRQMGGVNDLGPSHCTVNPMHLRGEELGAHGSRANVISTNFFRKQLSQPLQASNQQGLMVTTSLGNQVAPVSIVQSSEPRPRCEPIPKGEQGPHSLLQKLLSE
ncbi:DgyrCDS3830 [Dimorphilus gyrociliatus]|uniref:DgyrCDS3830 n=1 Tax=Dimorphilus gyrociliatus TaxID=2664684 RepID=A0A7I8VJP8_9ANNE|nr:DgyrCDS3830 [Dimorphilus gyrociliatus]